MRRMWLLLVLVALVVTTACSTDPSIGPDEAEVKGVRTERSSPAPEDLRTIQPDDGDATEDAPAQDATSPGADEGADQDEAGEAEDAPQPRETVTVVEERTVTETQTVVAEPADSGQADSGSTDDGGDSGQAAEEPSPQPTGPRLASRDGWSYVTWQPQDGSADGDWWAQVSASPPITRDDPEAAESEPVRVRLRAADDSTSAHRTRQATCQAWIVAPADHGWRVQGRLTVALVAGNVGRIVERHDLDTFVDAGEQLRVLPSTPQTVDAREERDVTCEARFDAR